MQPIKIDDPQTSINLTPPNTITFSVDGGEFNDPTPVSIPFGGVPDEPLHLRIRRMILETIAQQGNNIDVETIDEANDFTIEDDPESFTSDYIEPDYLPKMPSEDENFTPTEIEAAKAFIMQQRSNSSKSDTPQAGPSKEPAQSVSSSSNSAGQSQPQ